MLSVIPQRYKLFICCSIPEPKACLIFELSKDLEHIYINGFLKWLYNKTHNGNKAGVWWVQSPESMHGWLYFIEHKNDTHPLVL